MDIGLLNLRIQIQKNAVISDAIGNRKNTWTDYFSCYATIGGESGTEIYRAGEILESTDLTFTVRYSSETAAVTPSGCRGQNAFTNKVWCGSCGCKCERDNYGKKKRKIWCCSQPSTQCQMKRLPESELLEAAESLLGENFQAKVSADIDRVVVSDNQVDFEYKNGTVKTWQRK